MTKSDKLMLLFFLLFFPSVNILLWQTNVHLSTPQYKSHYKSIMKNIGSTESISNLKEKYFIQNLSIERIILWENELMTFVNASVELNRTDLNPINILENGIGRCGEYAIVFAALCYAQGIEARIVTASINGDHAWNEVKINGTWIHVDSSPPTGINEPWRYSKKNYIRVLGFESNGKVSNLTLKYNPNFWLSHGLLMLVALLSILIYMNPASASSQSSPTTLQRSNRENDLIRLRANL